MLFLHFQNFVSIDKLLHVELVLHTVFSKYQSYIFFNPTANLQQKQLQLMVGLSHFKNLIHVFTILRIFHSRMIFGNRLFSNT